MKKNYVMLVMTNPVDGREQEFNDWYTKRHIPDVLKIPGVVSAQRYRLAEKQKPNSKPSQWQYVATYNISCENISTIFDELNKRRGTAEMPSSDALAAHRESYIYEEETPLMMAVSD